MMAKGMGRGVMITVGLIVLGVILLAVGAVIEPTSDAPRSGSGIVDNLGQALIAFGLTLVAGGLGYFLAWGLQRTLAKGMM